MPVQCIYNSKKLWKNVHVNAVHFIRLQIVNEMKATLLT